MPGVAKWQASCQEGSGSHRKSWQCSSGGSCAGLLFAGALGVRKASSNPWLWCSCLLTVQPTTPPRHTDLFEGPVIIAGLCHDSTLSQETRVLDEARGGC